MTDLTLQDVTLSENGLSIRDGVSFERWQEIGSTLRQMESGVMWWIGDWVRYGERRYGEIYSQALDATDYTEGALRNAKWVAETYEPSCRHDNLSWSHHLEAARLPPDQRPALLEEAGREGWTTREVRAAVNRIKNAPLSLPGRADTCTVADLYGLIERGEFFGTIYADPPWLYDNQGTRAATGNHYGGMSVEELCELPVRELAAEDAHLHLWTTNGFLFHAPRIFDAWGFEFRSSLVWVKPQMGIGNYWRNSHEFLLTAIRGEAKRFSDKSLMSWLECDRGAHSAKPEKVRHMIERASPGPRLELFGRSPADGWTVWGNQIERGLLHQTARHVA